MSDHPSKRNKKSKKKQAIDGAVDPVIHLLQEQLFPTLASIISQSLRIHTHNYMQESIILLQNICNSDVLGTKDLPTFMKEELAVWQYRCDSRKYLSYTFEIVMKETIAKQIEAMHHTLKELAKTFKQCQFSKNSLPFELKGTTRYVANTMERIDILVMGYSIICHIFKELVQQDHTCLKKEEAILNLTYDILIEAGQTKQDATEFLHKLCLCMAMNRSDMFETMERSLRSCWNNRGGTGTGDFIRDVAKWSPVISGCELEAVVCGTAFDLFYRYVLGAKSLLMSLSHVNQRKNKQHKRKTARPPALSKQQLEEMKERKASMGWWSFLCSRTFITTLERKREVDRRLKVNIKSAMDLMSRGESRFSQDPDILFKNRVDRIIHGVDVKAISQDSIGKRK